MPQFRRKSLLIRRWTCLFEQRISYTLISETMSDNLVVGSRLVSCGELYRSRDAEIKRCHRFSKFQPCSTEYRNPVRSCLLQRFPRFLSQNQALYSIIVGDGRCTWIRKNSCRTAIARRANLHQVLTTFSTGHMKVRWIIRSFRDRLTRKVDRILTGRRTQTEDGDGLLNLQTPTKVHTEFTKTYSATQHIYLLLEAPCSQLSYYTLDSRYEITKQLLSYLLVSLSAAVSIGRTIFLGSPSWFIMSHDHSRSRIIHQEPRHLQAR